MCCSVCECVCMLKEQELKKYKIVFCVHKSEAMKERELRTFNYTRVEMKMKGKQKKEKK